MKEPKHSQAARARQLARAADPRSALALLAADITYLLDTDRITEEKANHYRAEAYHCISEVQTEVARARFADHDHHLNSKLGMHT